MKKLGILLALVLLLSGCSVRDTFETVSDVYDVPVMAQQKQLELSLPKEASAAAMETPDAGKLFLCDGYTLSVQTMDAGDLDRTLRLLTGYGKDQLTVMQTKQGEITRYESVWTAAGEGGDQIGRAVILDDGSYHYTVSVMADAVDAGELTSVWQEILGSAKLVSIDSALPGTAPYTAEQQTGDIGS